MGNTIGDFYAKKAKEQLPPSTQFALVTALPNITNGAFWGFTDYKTAVEHAEAFKVDKNITARKLSNACLVEVNPDYLTKAVKSIGAEILTEDDIACMRRGMAEAYVSFEKFLVNKAEKGYTGLVGIYCTNDSTAITHKGVSYPAFRINAQRALELCARFGYAVKVNGEYVLASVAYKSGQKLFDSMYLSPTRTGIFMEIKCTLTPEQAKELKKRYAASKK